MESFVRSGNSWNGPGLEKIRGFAEEIQLALRLFPVGRLGEVNDPCLVLLLNRGLPISRIDGNEKEVFRKGAFSRGRSLVASDYFQLESDFLRTGNAFAIVAGQPRDFGFDGLSPRFHRGVDGQLGEKSSSLFVAIGREFTSLDPVRNGKAEFSKSKSFRNFGPSDADWLAHLARIDVVKVKSLSRGEF